LQDLLEFARGPLFRLTFLIMLLGLARILILDIWEAVQAHKRAGDKSLQWGAAIARTVQWLFPVKRGFTQRPIYSLISIIFHIGLILVPVFLFAHNQLWQASTGVSWWTMPDTWADILTITTIITGIALFIGRVGSSTARALSRRQDYIWPLLLITPFITGYVCANSGLGPATYQAMMLLHILSSEMILVLLPFTKVAHCVLMPLSQFIISLAWKFPARVDEDICETLHKKGAPV
jgi:nitrate reductase gamma subunit